jgi:hypothetical protein
MNGQCLESVRERVRPTIEHRLLDFALAFIRSTNDCPVPHSKQIVKTMKLEKSECLKEGTTKMLVIGSSLCQTVTGVKDLRKSRDSRNFKAI